MAFHEVRFPTGISLGASGGPERRTEIVTLGSGFEERNQRWADSRRRYDAGYGLKSLNDIHAVIAFFEERRGRLHGFRWKDWADYRSCAPNSLITATDQTIGTGTAGGLAVFQLSKTYGGVYSAYTRDITKPVAGRVLIAVAGVAKVEGTDYTLDTATGIVTFGIGHIPGAGAAVTAGFEFDVPVRFDTDVLTIRAENWRDGDINSIPIVEIRV
jgi:uncharacterized protein (TIGR02217 family)